MRQLRTHLLVLCALVIGLLTGVHTFLQNALIDARFAWFPREASGGIALVAIDSPSIAKLGAWPWPRQHHAALVERLQAAGATEIVFDVDFSSPATPDGDHAFLEALRKAGGSVVLPAFKQLVRSRGETTVHVNRPLASFDANSWAAIVNVAVDPDGLVRRYPFGDTLDGAFIPSIGALLAGKSDLKADPLRIDFSIRANSMPIVSYADVLHGDPHALALLRGKKIVIGATAIELGDQFSVPNGQVMAGPQLQMLAAETILQGRVLRISSGVGTFFALGLLALLMSGLRRHRSAGFRIAALAAAATTAEIAAILCQARFAIVLDTSLWHLACAAYVAATAVDEIDFRKLLGGAAERRFQRIAMSLEDGLVCADESGRITLWNPGATAIFGYDAEEIIGRPLDAICALEKAQDGQSVFPAIALSTGLQDRRRKIMELVGRRKSGDTFPLEASFSKWEGVEGFQYGAVMRDISDRKREAERIRYLAEHDTLTGLANRHALYEHLKVQLADARSNGTKLALFMLDLDKFKQINDTLGHASGDRLLCGVAERLKTQLGDAGFVARLSGDEFAVVIGNDTVSVAQPLAERVCQTFATQPFSIGDRPLRINASIGIATFPDFGGTPDELFGNADLALYRAKAAGRGQAIMFEHRIRAEVEQRTKLETELGLALERGELELFYQPQVRLDDGDLEGAESLIRWRHPERGLVSPAMFMPLVNSSPMSNRIAQWVLETACRQGRAWQEQGHAVRLGVNLSPSQLQTGDLPVVVANVLKKTGFAPHLLELEVTEDILIEDHESAREIFRRIQDQGVQIAFDDFGTGFASLTYLKHFPLDRLKIDQSFVRELCETSDDAAIVSCTITLGKLLGLKVIAEGIESAETAAILLGMGCQEGQGYHFGQPMPAADFERRFLAGAVKESAKTTAAKAA